MAELSLTGWLDPALKWFADQAKIPLNQYSSQVGGEGIAVALEQVVDFFLKGWLPPTVQFITGLAANSYAWFGKEVPERLRRELLAWGHHSLFRVAQIRPEKLVELRSSAEKFADAVRRGDVNAALASIIRSPTEVQEQLAKLGVPVRPPAVPPTPVRPPAEGKYAPTEGGYSPAKGRYTVTE